MLNCQDQVVMEWNRKNYPMIKVGQDTNFCILKLILKSSFSVVCVFSFVLD